MKSPTTLFILTLCLLAPVVLEAQLRITEITRRNETINLNWQGNSGPALVEVSPDLLHWSDQGEPARGTNRTLAAFNERRFHRVRDLDPAGEYGSLFGLLQTQQGELGALLARHRLKTRVWMYKTKGAPHTSSAHIPIEYWRKLLVNWQSHEDGNVRTWSGPLENLGTVATPASQRLTITWSSGSGTNLRTTVLTMDFPYPVNTSRSSAPHLSDPAYALKCTYATAQPELDFGNLSSLSLGSTHVDSANLAELDPTNDPSAPGHMWPIRQYRVSNAGVQVELHYLEGLPLLQGSPPWIFKTLLLDRWLSPTTMRGGELPAISTDSYFARTMLPGHHNFYEIVLIEPALDPALPEATRTTLRESNIRYIYTFKDLAGAVIGGEPEDIRYFGYDNRVRRP
jgi:hypothetical protein